MVLLMSASSLQNVFKFHSYIESANASFLSVAKLYSFVCTTAYMFINKYTFKLFMFLTIKNSPI